MIVVVNNTLHPDLLQTAATRRLVTWLERADIPHVVIASVDAARRVRHATGIILSGSDLRLTAPICPGVIAQFTALLARFPSVPVLGVCFGHQLLALMDGGTVQALPRQRSGQVIVDPRPNPVVGRGTYTVTHNDAVTAVPPGWRALATTVIDGVRAVEAMQHRRRPLYGVQFHPELSGVAGERVLDRFVRLC